MNTGPAPNLIMDCDPATSPQITGLAVSQPAAASAAS